VGLVFQYPEHQLFEETVRADIAFGPKNMGLSDSEIERRVIESAEIVGLKVSDLDRSPFELSGGQKRRAALAGVLAMEPEVLVLDEPMAGLDPEGRDNILSKIKAYRDENQAAVIIVSHSMEDMAKTADNLLVLSGGEVKMFDTVKNVFSKAEELSDIGLDIPEVTKIAIKLNENGINVPKNVFTVEQLKNALLNLKNGGAAK
jgi:energy-coupling factor transport system ATP-binding protein